MIEALNSNIANAALVRGTTEQAFLARPSAISSAPVAEAGGNRQVVLAPYISPFVYVDNQFNKAVLQIRDSETGEVQRQFPSEQTLRARAAEQAYRDEQLLSQELSKGEPATTQAERQPAPQASQGTLQSATLFAASQIGSAAAPVLAPAPQIRISTPALAASSAPASSPSVNIAQAQIASAALSASSVPTSGSTVNTSV